MTHYETVFILNPVLSDDQVEETVKKFEDFLIKNGAKMVSKENWGLKKIGLSDPKQKKVVFTIFSSLPHQVRFYNLMNKSSRGMSALCVS